jgi:hypothetical protein
MVARAVVCARTQVNRISGNGGAAARRAEVQWLPLWPPTLR